MNRTESRIQRVCVEWFRWQYPQLKLLLFAVPNGGGRSKVEAGILKAEGVTAGVADLLLLYPSKDYHALCIEMKTERKGSKQRETQIAWQEKVESVGYKYIVCRSLDEFQQAIIDYLGEPTTFFIPKRA